MALTIYYDEAGKQLGRAWSVMQCKDMEDHAPHSHEPEFGMFGPYMCAGFPAIALYDTPQRKPINKKS